MIEKLNLGFRAHDFGKFDSISQLAETASSFRSNSCLHLAPGKALNNTPYPLDKSWADETKSALDRYGISIAILGCYINPLHPDKAESQLQIFENGIEIAPHLGYPIVATETGSVDARNIRCEDTWTDKNFSLFLKRIERLLECAEKNNVTMALEAVADKNTIDTPLRMLKVMETFKSSYLRVLFDAVNIFPIKGTDNINLFYDECVDMLSPYICAMHIKDFIWTDSNPEYPYASGMVKKGTIPVGQGLMPWDEIFYIYRKYKVDGVPMTLENFIPSTLTDSLAYCDKAFAKSNRYFSS